MYVSKFGGTSVADKKSIELVLEIIKDDPKRKYIVVSAPGKRFKEDTKITDNLIELTHNEDEKLLEQIINRFEPSNKEFLRKELIRRTNLKQENQRNEAILAFGEYANAYQIASMAGISFVDSFELLDLDENRNILPSSIQKIKQNLLKHKKAIIPGFYGKGPKNQILTMGRGSSDLSGAFIASALNADIYENFTDSGVCVAHPDIIKKQHLIKNMTYKELRNLSFGGFSIFHPRSMLPLIDAQIPIHIRSTKNYPEQGTIISSTKGESKLITGIAYEDNYTAININLLGIHEQIGVMANILNIFAKNNISVDFTPTGIDDITIVARNMSDKALQELNTQPYKVDVYKNIGCIVVAGEGLKNNRGSAARIQAALTDYNLKFISHGIEESCIIYGLDSINGKQAVQKLYQEFF